MRTLSRGDLEEVGGGAGDGGFCSRRASVWNTGPKALTWRESVSDRVSGSVREAVQFGAKGEDVVGNVGACMW